MPAAQKKVTPAQARQRADRLIESMLSQAEALNKNASHTSFKFDTKEAKTLAKKETSGLRRLAKYVAILGAVGAAGATVYYINPNSIKSLEKVTKGLQAKLPTGSEISEKLQSAWLKVKQGMHDMKTNVLKIGSSPAPAPVPARRSVRNALSAGTGMAKRAYGAAKSRFGY